MRWSNLFDTGTESLRIEHERSLGVHPRIHPPPFRNLTPDQIAAVWTQHGLWEEEDARKAKAKAAFKSDDERRSPGGKPVVAQVSEPPQEGRDYAKKNANSTVGRIAQKAKISRHKPSS